ncbi:MAG: hypothetical protein K6F66_06640 [Pseudobutyrivibrio sp.]|nr:hypothetical protein [Pseudobutyrivibrio sp.]
MGEVEIKIKEIIIETMDGTVPEDITEKTKLITSGFLDSFGIISMLETLESTFDVVISLEDVELSAFETIESIAGMINAKKGQ